MKKRAEARLTTRLDGGGQPRRSHHHTYDALDRLTAINGPTAASYTYNGLGLRVSATVGMTTTRFAWDLAAATPVVLSDGPFAEYVYGQELLGKAEVMGVTYAHADVLGSVRLLTDGGGNAVGSAQYDAFGAVRSQSGTQLAFGFAGQQQDPESGLV
jgi:YD repeat-containing protein